MAQWLEAFPQVRPVPRLWVETVWLLESREPFAVTRTIPLRQGLNIVWAKESGTTASPGLRNAGHGVGKTSLCLLLRYALGDDAPAVGALREKAVSGFPKGGIAAKVHVDGVAWVVFRPYGAHGHSLAAAVDSLDALLAPGALNQFQAYLAALEAFSIGRLTSQSLPGSNQPLKWRHLLAWCIRDQHKRFDGFYNWRDGEGMGFTRPRRDPPVFVSSVLGMLDADLDELIRTVEAKQVEVERAEARLPDLEREPELMLSGALRELRLRVNAAEDEPVFQDIASDSIESRVAEKTIAALALEADLEAQVNAAEDRVMEALGRLNDLKRGVSLAEVEVGIARSRVTQNQPELDRFIKLRETLQNPTGRCDIGGIEISACEHVLQRRERPELNLVRDEREVKQTALNLAAQLQSCEQALEVAKAFIKPQELLLSNQRAEGRRLRMRIATSEASRATLKQSWDALKLRQQQRDKGLDNAELVRAREQLATGKRELDSLKARLEARKSQKSNRSDHLKALTRTTGARMLGASGHVRFVPGDEHKPFEVAKGGEAYQVLEVLLGDVVCLIDSATSDESRHPGFLVHDCPREADMSELLYREFFMAAVEAAEQLTGTNGTPFQFIVTTTSAPPPELQSDDYVVLELEPGVDDKLLFKRELMPTLPGFELQ